MDYGHKEETVSMIHKGGFDVNGWILNHIFKNYRWLASQRQLLIHDIS